MVVPVVKIWTRKNDARWLQQEEYKKFGAFWHSLFRHALRGTKINELEIYKPNRLIENKSTNGGYVTCKWNTKQNNSKTWSICTILK